MLVYILDFLQIASGLNQTSPLNGVGFMPGVSGRQSNEDPTTSSRMEDGLTSMDAESEQMKIDKSNILLLGPTGSGKNSQLSLSAEPLYEPETTKFKLLFF